MRLLYLDAHGLIVCRKLRGQLCLEGEFAATEAGIEAFAHYAHAHRRSTFRLVTDLADESYHFEILPQLRGADRRVLLARKRTQSLPPTPFATTVPAGPAGGRQENVLHIGITRAALLEPWLAALNTAQVALASAHCAAQSAPRLFKPSEAPTLILTRTRAGLRQMFLQGRYLRFSRLTPLPAAGPLTLDDWLSEAEKTRQYLIRERALDHGTPLILKLVGEGLQPQAPRFASFDISTFAPADLARPLGLTRLPAALAVESLLLWALQKTPPREQLAPATARRHHQLAKTRRQVYAASVVAALAAGVFIADRAVDTERLHDATHALPPLAALAPTEAPAGLPALREITRAHDNLARRSLGPVPLLTALSRELDTHPAIELDALEWALVTSGTRTVIERIQFTGHLSQTLADPRAQLEAVSQFTRSLSDTARLEVSITRLPIDIAPDKTLNSQSTPPPGQAPFALTLTRSLP